MKFLQTLNDIPIKIIEINGIDYNDAIQMQKILNEKYGYKHTFLPEIMASRNYYNLNTVNITEEIKNR